MKLLQLFGVILTLAFLSTGIAAASGADFLPVMGVTTIGSFIATGGQGVLYAGINQEIWTDILVTEFNTADEAGFLKEIPDESRYVSATRGENEVIHLSDIGADPEVLINNTTYPIGFYTQTDADISITLDSYKTVATKVLDEEIQYISYDKIKLVQAKHVTAVKTSKYKKAIHALAPNGNTANTPVIKTTGPDDGNGRKRLVPKDILTLKEAWDELEIPEERRILVLSTQHHNDLLAWDLDHDTSKFAKDETGKLKQLIEGFKVYTYVGTPYFHYSTAVKLAFGAIPTTDHYKATVAFYAPDMFKAIGKSKNYTDEPTTQNHAWFYNVRHNYIVLPKKERAISAIISDKV